jgi:nitrite reductase/ring-hydroxylating ferredoxin subunit
MAKHVVGAVAEIPPGGKKIVEVAGRTIGIFNLGGEFFALRNRCPHQGAPLCEGKLGSTITSTTPGHYEVSRSGEILRCPWHGWEFDVRNGQSGFDPKRVKVRSYPVAVESGEVLAEGLAKGPYVAETFPVHIEDSYVIIET